MGGAAQAGGRGAGGKEALFAIKNAQRVQTKEEEEGVRPAVPGPMMAQEADEGLVFFCE